MGHTVYSVSYFSRSERFWVFCGEGDLAWATERVAFLRNELPGYKVRKRVVRVEKGQ